MSEPFDYDVFLSHGANDKPVVRDLAERLRKDGLRVWFDEWEIRPGDSIPAKIEEGLELSYFGFRISAALHVGECVWLGSRGCGIGVRHVPLSRPAERHPHQGLPGNSSYHLGTARSRKS